MPSQKVLAEFQSWTAQDQDRWSTRNQRFQRDQELYQLTKPSDLRARVQQDILILNDPKVLVKKVARLIARHPNVIEVPASPDVAPDVAQRVENFLYGWDQARNQRWMFGLHNPYRYDQAFFLVLRGWLAERTMLRPDGSNAYGSNSNDPSELWDHQVFDPANVYPYAAANQLIRVTHCYSTSCGELRVDPFFGKRLKGTVFAESYDQRDSVNIKACYWRDSDGSWWHGVTAGGGQSSNASEGLWLKEPKEIGYCPWTIVLANGASYAQTPWDEISYLEQIGTGILDEGAENFRQINRIATKLNELLSLESNPPVSIYTRSGGVRPLSFEPGARNFFAEKDRLEAHRIGPSLNDYQLLWDILQKRADRAGLPSAFFSEYGGDSGFSATVMMAAGKDVLFPFVEAINQADALIYRKVLEQYRDYGPNAPLKTKQIPDGLGRVLSATITPQEIKDQGTFVEITREDMTPQELATRINLALAMVRDKVISLKTARKEWVKLKNPDKENLQVLAELTYLNEDVTKALVPLALGAEKSDVLRKIWEQAQNPTPQPGMTPQGMAPEAATPAGMPSEVMPPIMAGNMLTNNNVQGMGAEINPLLALLQGGAQGGAGGGGLPPVPGTTNPVPLFLPPNRL